MNIKRFDDVIGCSIELLSGQARYAYGFSRFEELWEIQDYIDNGGYPGATIQFYDLYNGQVYTPFEKEKSVMYASPYSYDGYIYFLQGNFNVGKVMLYKYLPNKCCEVIHEFLMNEVNLYNFSIIGSELYVISQDEKLICYYPEYFEIPLRDNESVEVIDHDYIYFNAWIEEGVVNDTITSDYQYYDKVVVKDKKGNIISEEIGALHQMPDGNWWIS